MRVAFSWLLLGALAALNGSCVRFTRQPRADYRTVLASPNRDPDRAAAANCRAEKELRRGRHDKAEGALQEALVADVTHGPAHNNLGMVYYLQGKYYLAAHEYAYASRLMPQAPEPHNNLGLVYESAGQLDPAIAYYTTAHQLCPDAPEFIGNLARARLKRGDQDPDLRELLQLLVLRETRPKWTAWARELLARDRLPTYESARAPVQPPESLPAPVFESDSVPPAVSPSEEDLPPPLVPPLPSAAPETTPSPDT